MMGKDNFHILHSVWVQIQYPLASVRWVCFCALTVERVTWIQHRSTAGQCSMHVHTQKNRSSQTAHHIYMIISSAASTAVATLRY